MEEKVGEGVGTVADQWDRRGHVERDGERGARRFGEKRRKEGARQAAGLASAGLLGRLLGCGGWRAGRPRPR